MIVPSSKHGQPKADNYHCTWTKDSVTGAPLLCVAGANAKIKIYNVVTGTLERVCNTSVVFGEINVDRMQEITGHGGVSPPVRISLCFH